MDSVLQFGTPEGEYITRPSVYGVILNAENEVLVMLVHGIYHLPGGGIGTDEELIPALQRELMEEAGCVAHEYKYIGKANQFYTKSSLGPLNKLGSFYVGKCVSRDKTLSNEDDHEPFWLSQEAIESGNMREFQKWAVAKVFDDIQ